MNMDSCVLWLEKAMQGRKWIDQSKYNNNGAMTGARFKENAIEFDGIDDYVNCGNSTSLDVYNIFTIESLIKPHGADEMGYIVAKGVPTVSRRYNMYWAGNTDEVRVYTAGVNTSSLTVFTDSYEWVHVAISVVGTAVKFYRNGKYAGVGDTGLDPVTNTDNLYLGNRGSGTSGGTFLAGEIALVRIYNKDLTAQQIKELFEQTYRKV